MRDDTTRRIRPIATAPGLLALAALLLTGPASAQELAPPAEEPGAEEAVATRAPSPGPASHLPNAEAESDLGSLSDVLPEPLFRDLIRLHSRVQSARRVLFGRRGIVGLGRLEPGRDHARLRLNLQYSPDPGIRFTLVTG